MRRTFATLRCAVGDDPAYTAAQLGHTDARFTMRVYTGATKHRERLTAAERRAYDQAVQWALMTAALDGDAAEVTERGTPVAGPR